MNLALTVVCLGIGGIAAAVWFKSRFSGADRSGTPSDTSSGTPSSTPGISDVETAQRLARAIASDIALYQAAACVQARDAGVIPAALGEAIAEGRTLFEARVRPHLFRLYNTAIDELVVRMPRG